MGRGLTRRDMLAVIGGAGVGGLLSPLPWKTLDDVAIWSQNWSWRQQAPRGPIKTESGVCTRCEAGCALHVRTVAGQPFATAPSPGHARGDALCALGLCLAQMRFHPGRLTRAWRHDNAGAAAPLPVDLGLDLAAQMLTRVRSAGGRIAVLDGRPGRAASFAWRRLLAEAAPSATYLPSPTADSWLRRGLKLATAAASTTRSPRPEPSGTVAADEGALELGLDLEQTRTLLLVGPSDGLGLGLGGGAHGRSKHQPRCQGGPFSEGLFVIQAEPCCGPAARDANLWLPIRPGGEMPLLLGLAHLLVADNLVDWPIELSDASPGSGVPLLRTLLESMPPARAAAATGLTETQLRETARILAARGPSLVVPGFDRAAGGLGAPEELAALVLNSLLGAFGRPGGIIARTTLPSPIPGPLAPTSEIAEVPAESIDLLVIDEAERCAGVPWPLLKARLRKGASVIATSLAGAGLAREATLVLPLAAPFESVDESPTPCHSPMASLAIAPVLTKAAQPTCDSGALVAVMARALGVEALAGATPEELLRMRVRGIAASGRGSLAMPGEAVPVDKQADAEAIWSALVAGACWVDGTDTAGAAAWAGELTRALSRPECVARMAARADGRIADRKTADGGIADGKTADDRIPDGKTADGKIPDGERRGSRSVLIAPVAAAEGLGALPPALAKVYREGGHARVAGWAFVHPQTATEAGIADGAWAEVTTGTGRVRLRILHDGTVAPGLVRAVAAPQPSAFGDDDVEVDVLGLMREEDGSWRLSVAELTPL